MISREEEKTIEIARRYGLVPGTKKCLAFLFFDEGYGPKEVRYLLRRFKVGITDRAFANSIRRYYYTWKKENDISTTKNPKKSSKGNT